MNEQNDGWVRLKNPFPTRVVHGQLYPAGTVTLIEVKINGSRDTARFRGGKDGKIFSANMLGTIPKLDYTGGH